MAASMQSMCQYWKKFDLHELQRELDTTATELATRQDESDASRKRLVEQSREFKKNTAEDIRKIVAPLLKGFQGEVDALSKRAKAGEAAFLAVYKKLIDVPDPAPVLEQALSFHKKAQRGQDLEIENKQLRETLDDYNNEFADVKNQEVTIKQLREKVKEYESSMEVNAQARAKEKERELQRQFNEKERQLHDVQVTVAKKLGEAEHKVATLQQALDSTQSELFELKTKYDEATSAKSDEIEMVVSDLERATERAAHAEREIERLSSAASPSSRSEGYVDSRDKPRDMEQAIDILKRSSLEVELAAKEKEITQLVEDVQRLQTSLNQLREASSDKISKLEDDLNKKSLAFQTLEEKIKSQTDYEEIKRELEVMKSIEFSQPDEDESQVKSLELLLLEKNKTLQTEKTALKSVKEEISGTSGQQPVSQTDAFASMLGQEIAASYYHARAIHEAQEQQAQLLAFQQRRLQQQQLLQQQNSPRNKSPGAASVDRKQDLHSLTNSPTADARFVARQDLLNIQVLDTADLSQRIREILSAHNIGQRLFAKHVLGLSQGTVSELLSKPKHWDKLTEKGRESYRKMYLWASDEQNIYSLKAISPKKGAHPIVSNMRQEDSATEERVAAILSDAQKAMQDKQKCEQKQVASAMVASIYQQELNRMNNNNSRMGSLHRLKKPDDDGISQDVVARIYQEELAKLAQSAYQSGNLAESNLYQQELARLAFQAQQKEQDQPTDLSRRNSEDHATDLTVKVKSEPEDDLGENEENMRHSGSAFFLVRPRNGYGNNSEVSVANTGTDSVSPLQRMQNIANSLVLKNNPNLPQRPLKPVLPPITQSDFDRYSNLNTDDVVKKVKDTLSQYSISQRLFGESCLGLSQGSVSDLLARPKPWHMLTQKGREPFIRMQIFLEDKESIPRLVANQYRIAPDKLMRSSSGFSFPHPAGSPALAMSTPSPAPREPSTASSPDLQSHALNLSHNSTTSSHSTTSSSPKSTLGSPHPPLNYQPSIFELAAMTTELDTLSVTSKVKEVLLFHNLGQKLFGEAILGLSQGSVSELLSKPKPWHMLSLKGREPFIKMQMWLNDIHNIEKLRTHQSEIKANRKRRLGIERTDSPQNSIKKQRVFFSDDQKDTLRLAYATEPYPNQETIECLANQLNVNSKTIINWFHNHRMRAKQQRGLKWSEMQDDVSTSSEMSIRETSQWLFPSFETVPNNCDTPGSDIDSESGHKSPPPGSIDSEGVKTAPAVNKRKSSNPQRAYQGVELEKSHKTDLKTVSNGEKAALINGHGDDEQNADKDQTSEDEAENPEVEQQKIERLQKIEKLTKGVSNGGEEWEEVDRKENIEKLEKNLTEQEKSEDDWEF